MKITMHRLFQPLLLLCLLLIFSGCSELQDLREIKQAQDLRIAELSRQLEARALDRDQLNRLNRQYENQVRELTERQQRLTNDLETTTRELETATQQVQALTEQLETQRVSLEQTRAALEEQSKLAEDLARQLSTSQADLLKARENVASEQAALKETQAKLEAAERDRTAKEREAAAAQAELATLRQQIAQSEASKGETVAALEKQLAEARQSLDKSVPAAADDPKFQEAFNLLRSSLQPHIDQKFVDVLRDERGVVVRLSNDYLFGNDVVQIDPAVHSTLDQIASILDRYPEKFVEVQGHTDTQPIVNLPFADNWALASARADKVVRYLAMETPMNPARLKSSSASQYRPASRGGADPKMDRRVDIILSNQP